MTWLVLYMILAEVTVPAPYMLAAVTLFLVAAVQYGRVVGIPCLQGGIYAHALPIDDGIASDTYRTEAPVLPAPKPKRSKTFA